MGIAIGAVAIGVILMVAFLAIAQVKDMMPSTEQLGNNTNFTSSMESSQATIIAGLGLLGIGVLIVAGFGMVGIFK